MAKGFEVRCLTQKIEQVCDSFLKHDSSSLPSSAMDRTRPIERHPGIKISSLDQQAEGRMLAEGMIQVVDTWVLWTSDRYGRERSSPCRPHQYPRG